MEPCTNYPCNVDGCGSNFRTPNLLVVHLRNFHDSLPNLQFKCGIDECCRMFCRVETFRKHVFTDHRVRWVCRPMPSQPVDMHLEVENEQACGVEADCDVAFLEQNDEMQFEQDEDAICEEAYSKCLISLGRRLAMLKLKLEHTFCIPSKRVTEAIGDINDFIIDFVSNIFQIIKKRVSRAVISDEILDVMLSDTVSLERVLSEALGKEADVLFLEFNLVEPVQCYPECPESTESGDEDTPSNRTDKESFQYVPILETIKSYISHKDVMQSIESEDFRLAGNRYGKMSSGSFVRNHNFFSQNLKALRIVLYTDEFGICSTMGPHQSMYKHCGVYFSIDNVDSKWATSQSSIFLAILAKYELVKKYSYHEILKPLIRDLKVLETTGISFSFEGKDIHVIGGLAAVLGDNLSQHNIGKFNPRFNGGLICRTCMVSYEDMEQVWREDQCVMRHKDTHKLHVEAVLQDSSLSACYGVYGESCFSVLNAFDPILSFPADEFHNNAFGFLENNIIVVTRGLVGDKVFNLEFLNEGIASFPYGLNDKVNKVLKLSKSVLCSTAPSMQGTGAEREHLFRMFSLIVGPHVPEDSIYWDLHLLANRITDIIMAPVIHSQWLPYLTELIYEHHKLWNSLPADIKGNFKPKLHYLVHSVSTIERYGAPRLLSCKKFERFHRNFKEIMRKCKNFINPAKTMAMKFQKARCLEMAQPCGLPPKVVVNGVQHATQTSSLPVTERSALQHYFQVGNVFMSCVNAVKIGGHSFRRDEYLILDKHDDTVVFFHTIKMYCFKQQWCLYGNLVFSTCFDVHLHAFEVTENLSDADNFVCISPDAVAPCQNLHVYTVNGLKYIKIRHWPSLLSNNENELW